MLVSQDFRRFDWILFVAALTLVGIGVAFIHSATYSHAAYYDYTGGRLPVWRTKAFKQFVWAALGLVTCVSFALVDYSVWRRWAYALYAAGLVSLVLLVFVGVTRGGSRRWFKLPGGYLLQPSEMMKIFYILALACYLMYRSNYRTLVGLVPPFLLALTPMLLIIRQPDLGTSLVFLPVLFGMLYVAGAKPKHLGAIIAAGMASAPLLWVFVMSARQRGRVVAFIDPSKDPTGSGYHIIESLVAIGTGGFGGHGFCRGPQSLLNKVPELETDFVFTVIAEEWGFLGGLCVILLYVIVFWRMFEIAGRTREPFGRLVVAGSAALLAFQALVNLGMTMRLCPITGLTLPFVSYGGSSLLTNFCLLGIVIGIGMRMKHVAAPEDLDWGAEYDS